MGKNKKKGQDSHERICFLFEAAYTLMLACPSNLGLICSYGHMIKMLSKRTQTKLGPHIKRQICKKCHLILRPGVTSEVKLKSEQDKSLVHLPSYKTACKCVKHIEVTCKFCGTKKRFPSNPNHELYFDKIRHKIKNS